MEILYPVFAMVALTAFAAGRLGYLRVKAIRGRQISIGYFRTYKGDEEPDKIRIASRHLINLFETPVLFYTAAIMIYVTAATSTALVVMAWTYVALRYAHTAIHLGRNNVTHRFLAFVASGVVLLAIWVVFAARLSGLAV